MSMPYEIFVGLRYLRAKRRNRTISLNTFVSIAGITLGVAALIGTVGIMTGFKEDIQAKILGTTAHIIVQDRMKDGMSDYEPTTKQIEEVQDVVAATPFVLKQVLLTTPNGVQGIVLRGIDPQREGHVTELAKNLGTGELSDLSKPVKVKQPPADDPTGPAVETEKPGIILGKELAMRLGVFVGDTVNVVSPVGAGASLNTMLMTPKIRTFKVAAIFQSGMYEYDSSLALVHLQDAQRLYQMGEEVSGVRLRLSDLFQSRVVARDLTTSLRGDFYISDWTRSHANFFRAVQIEKNVMFVILMLIVAVAAFNIVSTLVMVVTDKQADIAILRTLGATPGSIMRIFIVQGALIGLIGTAVGLVLGVLLALPQSQSLASEA